MAADFVSLDPHSGRVLRDWPTHEPAELARALEGAVAAQRAWRGRPLAERAAVLARCASALRAEREPLALLAVREMGKPIREARAELDKCALGCEQLAAQGAAWLADEPVAAEGARVLVRREPLGIVLAIMPWNFPYWQVARCAAGALLAGNAIALKHSPNVQGCAEALVDCLARAGLPAGLLQNLRVPLSGISALLADERIAALSLTGSVRAGRSAAALAGAHGKKSVLELGGSDPFVVLADADLARAAAVGAKSRCINAGQSCIAAKRFIVEASVHADFARRLRDELARLCAGDPAEERTDLGPLARADLREALHRQVVDSVAAGARLVLGGQLPQGPGFHYPATLLDEVEPGQPAFEQETFGPLAAVVRARDAEHALELANRTSYGLGATLFTQRERGLELAARIAAGNVFVNELVRSDPRAPFGGIKASGFGRELGRDGLLEFTSAKTIWIA